MIQDKPPQLIDVLTQALKLSPLDKVKLVKQLASTLENDLVSVDSTKETSSSVTRTWGSQVLDMLAPMDTSEWNATDIPDVVEWVKEQRRQQDEWRGLYTGNPQ